jgi:quinolinate synthase
MSEDELAEGIRHRKAELGSRVVILGHHYQRDDVIRFADFTGDSLKLSQLAAAQTEAEFVVFCGVHFMAESADILTGDEVKVILPDLSAGCSMADMADIDDLEDAWDFLTEAVGGATIIPITYVNSTAAIKAFCGRHGGACCTSTNARAMLEWALDQGDKVIFLPDQHLGRNTAYALGYRLDSMVMYDPKQVNGGLTAEQAADAKFLFWKGHCSVHGLFTAEQCDEIREIDSEFNILVHPECPWEVVQNSDYSGSTEFIINTVEAAEPGTKWAIGTEVHLVNRLADRHSDKMVRSLAGIQCLCTTMYRIDMKHLLWVLDELAAGRVVNQIRVDDETSQMAVVALDRMLARASAPAVD